MRSVSDLDLERFLVDDLEPAEREFVSSAVANDVELQAFVAHRRAEQQQWRNAAPAWQPPVSLSSRLTAWFATIRTSVSATGLALSGAAAGIALLLVGLRDEPDVIRARGGGDVVVAVQRDGHVFRHEQQPLRSGDAVRLGGATPRSHVSVVSIDVHGVVALVLDNAVVDEDGWIAGSLVLDDSEGPERFAVAMSSQTIDAKVLVELVRTAALSSTALTELSVLPALATAHVQQLQLVGFEKEVRP